jgi:hypothetical protein
MFEFQDAMFEPADRSPHAKAPFKNGLVESEA